MASASVTLRGRFKPKTEVRLVRVQDERALRSEGGEEVATETVDENGCVEFSSGVKEGERYFIVGQVDGTHLEVRARGRSSDDPNSVLGQAPPPPTPMRYANGELVDEDPPEQDLPELEAAPHLSQQQVQGEDLQQRSDTPRGTAHPVEEEEQAPYPRQDQLEGRGKVKQMADDGEDVDIGMATPTDVAPQRQQDVPKGTPQRSDTPAGGTATVIASDGPVEAQRQRESVEAKIKRGEPVKAAASPIGGDEIEGASEKDSRKRHDETVEDFRKAREAPAAGAPSELDDTSGRDAHGQPADENVARAAGVEPADKPAEAGRSRSEQRKAEVQSKSKSESKPEPKKPEPRKPEGRGKK